jgi:hypothetical protein
MVVFAAIALAVAVFALAKPGFHHASHGGAVSLARYPAASDGWTWRSGEPGFVFGKDEASWNISELKPAELLDVRVAAAFNGLDPTSIRPLRALRLGPRNLYMLVAGTDDRGRTCIGAVLPRTPASFYCPGVAGARRLGPQLALVVVVGAPRMASKLGNGHGFTRTSVFPLFLLGINRSDVERVEVTAVGRRMRFYARADGAWGTFEGTPGVVYPQGREPRWPWRAELDFFGAHGRVARLPIRLERAGAQVFAVQAP